MNKIVKEFLNYTDSKDVLNDVYHISSDEKYDYVLVAPSWGIEKVFDVDKYKCKQTYNGQFSISHEFTIKGKRFLYVSLQIGSPNMVDFCLSCYKLKCDNFIFLGSAGALDKDLKLGDIIIPRCSISAVGATLYLNNKLSKDDFLEHVCPNKTLTQKIEKICKMLELPVLNKEVISVDSVMAEYAHLKEYKALGASVIEMETAAFFKSIELIKKKAAAILIISDNSANGEHLVGRTDEQRARYYKTRANICKIIENL